MYTSDRSLKVPANDKLLNLEIVPNKKQYKPRETASYTILARNTDGTPAPGAEVSLGLVDEAIYSIKPDSAGDIYKGFYGHRYNQVQTNFAVSYYFSAHPATRLSTGEDRRAFQWPTSRTRGIRGRPFARSSKTRPSGSRRCHRRRRRARSGRVARQPDDVGARPPAPHRRYARRLKRGACSRARPHHAAGDAAFFTEGDTSRSPATSNYLKTASRRRSPLRDGRATARRASQTSTSTRTASIASTGGSTLLIGPGALLARR